MGSVFSKGSEESAGSEFVSRKQAEIAERMTQLAEEQARMTAPIRRGTANIFKTFLDTGVTPSFLDLPSQVRPLAALSLPSVESEQQLLKGRLIAQGNRGGLLQQQLAQMALQGGLQRTGLLQQDLLRQEQRDVDRSGIARTLFGGAADLGTGGLALALQGIGQGVAGMGGAAGNLNVLGGQRITQNLIAQQGIGQILGKVLGSAAGGAAGGPAGAAVGGSKGGSAGGSAVPKSVMGMFGG